MTILLPHLRQPSQWAEIDRANPLTREMVELLVPHHLRSAASAMPQMTGGGTGTRGWQAGRYGVCRRLDRSAVLEDRYPQERGVSGDITVFMLGGTDGALGSTQRLVLLQTTAGTRRCALGEEGTSKFAFNTNPSGGSSVDAVESTTTLGEEHFYVGRLSGTAQTLWVDGVSVASNTQSGSNFSDVGKLSLNTTGFLSGASGRVYLAGWLARAWSDEEIVEVAANPWALFAPLRIFVAGSSGTAHSGATSESITAADSLGVSGAFVGARAEAVAAADAPAASAVFGAATAESVAPADVTTGDIGAATYAVSRDESVSAADAAAATAQYAAGTSEALSAADAADGQLVTTHNVTVAEALAPSDASDGAIPGAATGGGMDDGAPPARRRRYVVQRGSDLLVFDTQRAADQAQAAIDAAAASARAATSAQPSKRAARRERARAFGAALQSAPALAQPAEVIDLGAARALAQQYQRAAQLEADLRLHNLVAAAALWHDMLDEEDAETLLMAA